MTHLGRGVSVVLIVVAVTFVDVVVPTGDPVSASVALALQPSDGGYESQEVTGSFDLVGFTWDRGDPGSIEVRVRTLGGWGPWRALPADADHAPDRRLGESNRQRPGTEPLWIRGGRAAQFRTQRAVPGARAELIRGLRAEQPGRRLRLDPNGADAAVTIHPRSDWDPTRACAPADQHPPIAADVELLYVHHTTSSNAYAAQDVPRLIRAICNYHVFSRGWNDIGYNFVVDRFGGIWEARDGGIDRGVIGGHSQGFNSHSQGIALLGDFTSTTPTPAMVDATRRLIAHLATTHDLDPRGSVTVESLGSDAVDEGTILTVPRVLGHRDTQATACPGDRCYALLPSMRVAAPADTTTGPSASRFATRRWAIADHDSSWRVVGDFTGDGRTDVASYESATGTIRIGRSTGGGFAFATAATLTTLDGWTGPLVADVDGDRSDDLILHHPSNGSVWVLRAAAAFRPQRWATIPAGDGWSFEAAGDFDADTNDDVIIAGPGGERFRLMSFDDWRFDVEAGPDMPMPEATLVGDFDSSAGADDVARFGGGRWTVAANTRAGTATSTWGTYTTRTGWEARVVGDFDGDGRDDVAQFHPSNGTWWVGRSTGSGFATRMWADFFTAAGWGDRLVGEFTGDGRDDIANFHPGNGTWWVSRSTGSALPTSLWADFTTTTGWDHFVGDADGDGIDDIIGYHPSNRSWWASLSR